MVQQILQINIPQNIGKDHSFDICVCTIILRAFMLLPCYCLYWCHIRLLLLADISWGIYILIVYLKFFVLTLTCLKYWNLCEFSTHKFSPKINVWGLLHLANSSVPLMSMWHENSRNKYISICLHYSDIRLTQNVSACMTFETRISYHLTRL